MTSEASDSIQGFFNYAQHVCFLHQGSHHDDTENSLLQALWNDEAFVSVWCIRHSEDLTSTTYFWALRI